MPARQKINLEKVKASLATPCSMLRIRDSTGRTAPHQFHASSLPKMRRYFHRKRFGLNCGNSAHKSRTLVYQQPPFENTILFVRKLLHPHGRFRHPLLIAKH